MDIVHYLLNLHYLRPGNDYSYFTVTNSICYAKRFGQSDLLLLLEVYSQHIQGNVVFSSKCSSNASEGISQFPVFSECAAAAVESKDTIQPITIPPLQVSVLQDECDTLDEANYKHDAVLA